MTALGATSCIACRERIEEFKQELLDFSFSLKKSSKTLVSKKYFLYLQTEVIFIMVRKYILLFVFLLVSIISKAESDRLLIFETTEGAKVTIALSENPELTFSGQTMIVTTNAQTQKIEISSIAKWYYENVPTGINPIKSFNKPIISKTNNEIIVEGLSSTPQVQVYSIDGKKQSVKVSLDDGGRSIINLSSLPKGVYVVSINKFNTIKIFKQ